MCDLFWLDLQLQNGCLISKWGVSCQFGFDVIKVFLEENNLDYIICSYEVKVEGYEVVYGGCCVIVFFVFNYCDQMGNKVFYIYFQGFDLWFQFYQFIVVFYFNVKFMVYVNMLLQLGMM